MVATFLIATFPFLVGGDIERNALDQSRPAQPWIASLSASAAPRATHAWRAAQGERVVPYR
jgi:hypothetical protein